uniref:Putative peroxinectin-like protein n=1 Tax=Corethrella appendiculata TaxID=1370023 RepID=U5ES00_9DIPT
MTPMIKFWCLTLMFQLFKLTCALVTIEKPHLPHNHLTDYDKIPDRCTTNNNNNKCVKPIQCPAHLHMNEISFCSMPESTVGICCTTGYNHSFEGHYKIFKRSISENSNNNQIYKAIENGKETFAETLEYFDNKSDIIGKENTDFHAQFFKPSDNKLEEAARNNKAVEEIFIETALEELRRLSVQETDLNTFGETDDKTTKTKRCILEASCTNVNRRYRRVDGRCNNPLPGRGLWGSSGFPMERLLPPAYEDSIWKPRQNSVLGGKLLSPRTISRKLLPDVDRPHPKLNLLTMQFGQFITHDVSQSASITLTNGQPIECCGNNGSTILPPNLLHFACLPISIDPNDEFYSKFNQRCMNFVRSQLVSNQDCKIGYGKQLSRATHFIDGSIIYGTTVRLLATLRTFSGGKLRVFNHLNRELLPQTNNRTQCETFARACFVAGDSRVNQIISLTAVQTLFLREHNRIAGILSSLNPHWKDETIFQETRRLIIAKLQHIAFNEYLPLIIGHKNFRVFSLNEPKGYSKSYNPDINPSITNEFSAAAFRFGHSTVDGKFFVHDKNRLDEIIEIPDVMLEPSRLLHLNFYDEIFRTLTNQPMQSVDDSITRGLSQFLFRGRNPFGFDLASLNIQRGRDHGLRPYNDYLELGGRKKINTFAEYGDEVGPLLEQVYKSPHDVDLWIGGLMERAKHGSIFGPTFSEIIADQFVRFKSGDRYYYKNGPEVNPGFFTPKQLNEIEKTSIARIICDNSDRIALFEQAPHGFVLPHEGNKPVPCDSNIIPTLDYSFWKD